MESSSRHLKKQFSRQSGARTKPTEYKEAENGQTYFVYCAILYCNDLNISSSFWPKCVCWQLLYDPSWSSILWLEPFIISTNGFSNLTKCRHKLNCDFLIPDVMERTVEVIDDREAEGSLVRIFWIFLDC